MSRISEFSFPKFYKLVYFQKFSWGSNLFYFKECLRIKDLATSII